MFNVTIEATKDSTGPKAAIKVTGADSNVAINATFSVSVVGTAFEEYAQFERTVRRLPAVAWLDATTLKKAWAECFG